MSIRRKLIVFFTVMVIIPVVTISTVFYVATSRVLRETLSRSNLQTVRQIETNIESVLAGLLRVSLELIQDRDLRDYLQHPASDSPTFQRLQLAAEQILHRKISNNSGIHSIHIRGIDGRTVKSREISSSITATDETRLRTLRGRPEWTVGPIVNYDSSTVPGLQVTRAINNIDNISETLGYLRISVSEQWLRRAYETGEALGDTAIIDRDGRVVSSSNTAWIGHTFPENVWEPIEATGATRGFFQTAHNDLVTYQRVSYTGWYLVNRIPLETVFSELRFIGDVLIYAVFTSFAIFTAAALLFINRAMRPLHDLQTAMARFETGDFGAVVNTDGSDEIAQAARRFNDMARRVDDLMKQVYVSTLKKREAELKMLQSQIKPHFLYNTLDTIYWRSKMERGVETPRLIQSLAQLFRLSLDVGDGITTVKREVEHLSHYMALQNERYDEEVAYHVDASDTVSQERTLNFILQPLVENALYHGIEPKQQGGRIDIRIFRNADALVFEITDDGVGADQDAVMQLIHAPAMDYDGTGFALKNVHDRVRIRCGEPYGVTFHSEPGVGTTVVVRQSLHIGAVSPSQQDPPQGEV
ncbi:MAG: sensor histidine kinase [Spirochaetales bacterium]|nr:sensor histidine kinase [Spirochaetales bacterium]